MGPLARTFSNIYMRIVQLTPGTGNFHCGSCLRDHAFLKSLREQGHEVVLVPMYLPLVTEGGEQNEIPIYFGGINVFLQTKFALFRNTPRWVDKLFDGRGALMKAASKMGMTKPRQLGEITVASLKGAAGPQRKEVDRLVDWLKETQTPDVVVLSNALLMGLAPRLRERLGVPIVCVLQGEDTFLEDLPEPYRTEAWDLLRAASQTCELGIAVSHYHEGIMSPKLDCPTTVVHNGMDLTGYAQREVEPDPPVIGYLARMCHIKGLGDLVDAFIELAHPTAKLEVVGTCMPHDLNDVEEMKTKLAAAGLADRSSFHPNVSREEKIDRLRGMTLLSVPAMYGESFGLYVIEANACAVPVVQPRHAAFPEVVGATGGGILFEPGPGALSAALRSALADPEGTAALGRAGADAVWTKFDVAVATSRLIEALRPIVANSTTL